MTYFRTSARADRGAATSIGRQCAGQRPFSRQGGPMTAHYFGLQPDPTPMHSLKLCTVLSGIPAPAAVMADAGAHSYSVWRNCMSESGALNRRKVVSGASSRASAFSFMARSAST